MDNNTKDILFVLVIGAICMFLLSVLTTGEVQTTMEDIPEPNIPIPPDDPNEPLKRLDNIEWEVRAQRSMTEQAIHMARKK